MESFKRNYLVCISHCSINFLVLQLNLHVFTQYPHSEWANGASMDMDWNTLKVSKRSYMDIVKEKIGANNSDDSEAQLVGLGNRLNRILARKRANPAAKSGAPQHNNNSYNAQYVTDHVLRQILLGENLLEIVYPDISIDTDNEFCPRCNFYLSDDGKKLFEVLHSLRTLICLQLTHFSLIFI